MPAAHDDPYDRADLAEERLVALVEEATMLSETGTVTLHGAPVRNGEVPTPVGV